MPADQSVTNYDHESASEESQQTPPPQQGPSNGARLNVNINARTANELRRLARDAGITYTEAVRRAVEVLAFVVDEQGKGHAIQVYDPQKDRTRELMTSL